MAWRWIWAPLLAASLAACSPLSWTSRNEGTPPSWGQVELGLSDQERALGEFLKGEVALRNGDTGFAIVSYENAARLEPDEPRLHGRLAHLYVRRGDLERALPHAQAAVAGNPDDDFSRTLLAGALAGLGRDKEAADHYREIIRRTPDQSDPYLLLASLHSKDGDDPAARATLEALLKTAPDILELVLRRYPPRIADAAALRDGTQVATETGVAWLHPGFAINPVIEHQYGEILGRFRGGSREFREVFRNLGKFPGNLGKFSGN